MRVRHRKALLFQTLQCNKIDISFHISNALEKLRYQDTFSRTAQMDYKRPSDNILNKNSLKPRKQS